MVPFFSEKEILRVSRRFQENYANISRRNTPSR